MKYIIFGSLVTILSIGTANASINLNKLSEKINNTTNKTTTSNTTNTTKATNTVKTTDLKSLGLNNLDVSSIINDTLKKTIDEEIDKLTSNIEGHINNFSNQMVGKVDEIKGKIDDQVDDLKGKADKEFERVSKLITTAENELADLQKMKNKIKGYIGKALFFASLFFLVPVLTLIILILKIFRTAKNLTNFSFIIKNMDKITAQLEDLDKKLASQNNNN